MGTHIFDSVEGSETEESDEAVLHTSVSPVMKVTAQSVGGAASVSSWAAPDIGAEALKHLSRFKIASTTVSILQSIEKSKQQLILTDRFENQLNTV